LVDPISPRDKELVAEHVRNGCREGTLKDLGKDLSNIRENGLNAIVEEKKIDKKVKKKKIIKMKSLTIERILLSKVIES
jgi:hypothetical protein